MRRLKFSSPRTMQEKKPNAVKTGTARRKNMDKKDNINERYEAYEKKPDDILFTGFLFTTRC